jgi:uncharacterized cupin superfamily protein
MESGVAFTKIQPGGDDRFQRLRQELGITTFGLNLIKLAPGQRGRIHRHEHQEEMFLVLEGTLTLIVEGDEREMEKGELVRVAPDLRRQLVNRHPAPLMLLAAGSAHEHVGRDGRAYEAWDEPGEGRPPQEVPLPGNVPVDRLT